MLTHTSCSGWMVQSIPIVCIHHENCFFILVTRSPFELLWVQTESKVTTQVLAMRISANIPQQQQVSCPCISARFVLAPAVDDVSQRGHCLADWLSRIHIICTHTHCSIIYPQLQAVPFKSVRHKPQFLHLELRSSSNRVLMSVFCYRKHWQRAQTSSR